MLVNRDSMDARRLNISWFGEADEYGDVRIEKKFCVCDSVVVCIVECVVRCIRKFRVTFYCKTSASKSWTPLKGPNIQGENRI